MAEEGFNSGMLTGLLSQRGIDPGMLAMLNKDEFGGNGLLFLLFLLILGGNGGWGNGNGVDRTVINEGNFNQLMQAVTSSGQNQANAIQSLAGNLNTDVSAIQTALAGVDKQLAVNAGDIRSAIQSCCCNIRTEIQQVGNTINTGMLQGFNALQTQASQIAAAQTMQATQNTDRITSAIGDLQTAMTAGFCDIKTRELESEVQRLRDLNAQQRDAANTQAILTALANKDTISYTGTVSGTTVSGTGTLS